MTGKTGSGKTTVSALVALACASRGLRVVAVDTDVSPNLALSLGLDQAAIDAARAVPRALVGGRGGGAVTTSQLIGGYGLATPSGVTLLHAMAASDDTSGCRCPAHASAHSLLASALHEHADVAVLDMEAGLEHLDRATGTMAHTDVLLVVTEPSRKSSVIAARAVATARDHGIAQIALVGNKAVAGDAEVFAAAAAELGVDLAGVLPYSTGIVDADRAGSALGLTDAHVRTAVEALVESNRIGLVQGI